MNEKIKCKDLDDSEIPEYITQKETFKKVYNRMREVSEFPKDKAFDGAQVMTLRLERDIALRVRDRYREMGEKIVARVGAIYAGYNKLRKRYPGRANRHALWKAFFKMAHAHLGLVIVDNDPNTRPRVEEGDN